jgi:molecular chaperone GrpE (heat shock protein)
MDRDAVRRPELPPDVHEEDEIEILEVVGLEEADDEISGRTEENDDEREEIVLEFPEEAHSTGDLPCGPSVPEPTVALQRFVRLQADFENFRKRIERERDEHTRHAAATLVEKLLPVLDNLERALAAPAPDPGAAALREGLVLIHRQFLEELSLAGLRPVEAEGKSFDPLVHEAVETVSSDNHDPNTVVGELQRGYWFRDRVLRPALVRVAVEVKARANDQEGVEDD